MTYTPKYLDYDISPYTGMTRESWIDAAKYLLTGAFSNLPSADAPMIVPRTETEITYPHKNAKGNALTAERMAQRFEGLARTLFIAAPLIRIDPKTELGGIELREYYSKQILRACTRGDENFVGYYEDLQKLCGDSDTYKTFQQTVETCALVIGLDACRGEIWERYTKAERDTIAKFLLSYAYMGTVPQNWRMFNMLVMAFLHREGYEIDISVMSEHAQAILSYYAGGGWYRDGHTFDYYSCWAFNVYAPIWNEWYGYEHEPYIAAEFEKNSNELMKTYPCFFDRDGYTNMWGRSCIYRNAAAAPLAENFALKCHSSDPGLARRIMSGSLLQFFSRDDTFENGVPTIGFYRQFAPLVQGYSCAESVYWLGKAFLCLNLPEDHPFWTAKENNGIWERLGNDVNEITLDGPALCVSNHGANGETILRTGKVLKKHDDVHGMWNYSKLAYNSKYPWGAAAADGTEPMQYIIKDEKSGEILRGNVTLWSGQKNGVLYRRKFFNFELGKESHWLHAVTLADMPVQYGILRADKLRIFRTPVSVTLGSYSFPDNGTVIEERSEGNARAVILKGYDSQGRKKQLAMTIYDGWEDISIIKCRGIDADSENSIVIRAKTERKKQYGYDRYMLISQTITKESHENFSDDELFPIHEIIYTDKERQGGYGPVELVFKNGNSRVIDMSGIEGALSL